MKLYDKVIHKGDNAYTGTIVEVHAGKLSGMVSVKWPGGYACESLSCLELVNA